MSGVKTLFIPRKNELTGADATNMRAIEIWAQQIGAQVNQGAEFFNITSFGAISGAGHDNTTAIQNAEAAACAAGGGIIFFPAGLWFSGAVTISCSNIVVWLAPGATWKCNTSLGPGGNFITITGQNVTIFGIGSNSGTIDGDLVAQGTNETTAVYIAPSASNCTVTGIVVQNTNHGVRSNATGSRICDNLFINNTWSSASIFLAAGTPITSGYVCDNVMQLPQSGGAAGGFFSGVNIQNNFSHKATASSIGTNNVSVTGYTVTGAEVGWAVEIVGAGPVGAATAGSSAVFQLPLITTITAASVGGNSFTLNSPTLPSFTNNVIRIIQPGISGIVIRGNELYYTSHNRGLAIQVFVATDCIIEGNYIVALPGNFAGSVGSAQAISLAAGWGHVCKGNVCLMNGNATVIEADSSQTVISDNVLTQSGDGSCIHCTTADGEAFDIQIINNNLTIEYGPNNGVTAFGIRTDGSGYQSGAMNVLIKSNTIHMPPALASPSGSACIFLNGPGYVIEGNTLDTAGCGAVRSGFSGSQSGRIVNNFITNQALTVFHYGPTGFAIQDLYLGNNQVSGDCIVNGTSGLPLDPSLGQGLQSAITASVVPNILYDNNTESGWGRVAPFHFITISSSPFSYTNNNVYKVAMTVIGQAQSGGGIGATNGLEVTVNGSPVTGRSGGANPFQTDAMGPLGGIVLWPGDTITLSWTGGNNPSMFRLAWQ